MAFGDGSSRSHPPDTSGVSRLGRRASVQTLRSPATVRERHELDPADSTLPARMPHQAWASDDALVFITVDAGWDVNWVSGPPTKSDSVSARPGNGPAPRAITVP